MKGTWSCSARTAVMNEIRTSTGSRPLYFSQFEKDKMLAALDYLRENLKERIDDEEDE